MNNKRDFESSYLNLFHPPIIYLISKRKFLRIALTGEKPFKHIIDELNFCFSTMKNDSISPFKL